MSSRRRIEALLAASAEQRTAACSKLGGSDEILSASHTRWHALALLDVLHRGEEHPFPLDPRCPTPRRYPPGGLDLLERTAP